MAWTPADISAYAGRSRLLSPVVRIFKPLVFKVDASRMIALAGRRTSGLPLGTAGIQLTGTTIRENLTDGAAQFETLKACIEHFHPDGIGIMADLSIEPEACGCGVAFPGFGLPYVVSHPVEVEEDIRMLEKPDPRTTGRMPVVLDVLERLTGRYGLPVGAGGIGPYTLAGEMIGAQPMALGTLTRPDFAHRLLEYASEVVLDYNLSQVKAGADTLVIAEPAGSILSADAFREYSGDYLKRVIEALPVPVTLHVCGDAEHLLDELVAAGPAGLSFDAPVDLPEAAGKVPSSIVLSGNLDPVDVVLSLSPDEIRSETLQMLEKMRPYPNYVLSSGCDIAPETPLENISAIIETVRRYRPGGTRTR